MFTLGDFIGEQNVEIIIISDKNKNKIHRQRTSQK
jgi:hypothetical protein